MLALAGPRPWAIWQENRPIRGGIFQTAFYAAALGTRAPGPARRLWRGRSIGPSDLSVVQAQGITWALYMPGRSREDPRLRVVLKPLRG